MNETLSDLIVIGGHIRGQEKRGGMPEDVGDGGDPRRRFDAFLFHQFGRELNQCSVLRPDHDLFAWIGLRFIERFYFLQHFCPSFIQ